MVSTCPMRNLLLASWFSMVVVHPRWTISAFSILRHSCRRHRQLPLQRQHLQENCRNNCALYTSFSNSCRSFHSSLILRRGSISDRTTESSSDDKGSNTRFSPLSEADLREELLHESLRKIHLNPQIFQDAHAKNLQDPTAGYDDKLGRSAIRAYRSFIYSAKALGGNKFIGKINDNNNNDNNRRQALAVHADRCARQIEFLKRRHQAHQTSWVRHTDDPQVFSMDSEDENGNNNPETKAKRFPIILLLDNIRSAFNCGSLFRTADAAGCMQVITTGITSHPGGSGAEKLSKSALGAERLMPHRHFSSTREALKFLQEEYPDWRRIGMETTDNSLPYTQVTYPSTGCVLILGNEVTGVEPDILQELDTIIEIPMFGAKNSLNVAACAPVVLYEMIRQWGGSIEKT